MTSETQTHFPPARIDATVLTGEELKKTLDELVEYGAVDRFVVTLKVDASSAREILRRSPGNIRTPTKASLDRYMRSMSRGEWRLTMDPMKFDMSGALIDGHTRLRALSQLPSTSVEIAAAFGLAPDVVFNLDQGAPRTIATVLSERPRDVAAVRAAMNIARWLAQGTKAMPIEKFSSDEVKEALERERAVFATVPTIVRYPAPVWAVIVLLFEKHADKMSSFAHELTAHETEDVRGVIRLLRLACRTGGARAAKYDQEQNALAAMTAARAYIENRDVSRLVINADGIKKWCLEQISIKRWWYIAATPKLTTREEVEAFFGMERKRNKARAAKKSAASSASA